MRLWHYKLIPHTCNKHLVASWREGLGTYSILVNKKTGYRNHPQVKQYEDNLPMLWCELAYVRAEMQKRGMNPKELPDYPHKHRHGKVKQWQTLRDQKEIYEAKHTGGMFTS